jgi:hypothetical protein
MIDLDLALSDLIGPTPGRGRRRPVLVEDGHPPIVMFLIGFTGIDRSDIRLEDPGPGDALR